MPRVTTTQIYKNSIEHIFDEIRCLDVVIRNKVEQFKGRNVAYNDLRGLIISDDEMASVLNENIISDASESNEIEDEFQEMKKKITQKVMETLDRKQYLSLAYLSKVFNLTQFEKDAIIICLAPEIEKRYGKIFAYLNDDITKKHATIELILSLTCHTREERFQAMQYLTRQSRLFKYEILQMEDEKQEDFESAQHQPVKLDERIVNFLLEIHGQDKEIVSFIDFSKLELEDEDLVFYNQANLNNIIPNYLKKESANNRILLNLHGPQGCGQRDASILMCKNSGLEVVFLDLAEIFAQKQASFERICGKALREASLLGCAVYLVNIDKLDEKENHDFVLKTIMRLIGEFMGIVFVETEQPWNQKVLENSLLFKIKFDKPDYGTRKKIFDYVLKKNSLRFDKKNVDLLASKFSLTHSQISNAVLSAMNSAKTRYAGDTITNEDLNNGCKSVSNQNLTKLAKKIKPNYTWDEIILPPGTLTALRDICGRVKNREIVYHDWGFDKKFSLGKGVVALFKGESGTGKTMAAEVIANDLELDLYKIDLSTIVSKYIGETEKNINKIFTEAETSNAILFFDEADALFGKRSETKDAHDRYANIETNYLLQKIEEYEGVVILATNFQKNIDQAFMRRMHFVIDFPFPDSKYRLLIWKNAFPEKTPINQDVDFKFLSEHIRLSGGNIKNVAINAAFLAAQGSHKITMKDIIVSVKQEYQKIGRPMAKGEFGKYASLADQ